MAMHEAIAWTFQCDGCAEGYLEVIAGHDAATQEAIDADWTVCLRPDEDSDIWHCGQCPSWCEADDCTLLAADCTDH